MAKYKHVADISYNTDEVFAAACAAYRINNGYVKLAQHDDDGNPTVIPNKVLVRYFLVGKFDIREEDRVLAEEVRAGIRGLTFKIIQGKYLSDFENTALSIADSNEIAGNYFLAVASSLPEAHIRQKQRSDVEFRLRMASGSIEHNGDRVNLTIEVVRCFYSKNYNRYFITAITSDNKAVFFGSQNSYTIGSTFNISCKIKHYKEDENLNKISHVKEVI